MTKIEIECCDGEEKYPGQCLRDRCPNYSSVRVYKVSYIGTGFGNLLTEPILGSRTHEECLRAVRDELDQE